RTRRWSLTTLFSSPPMYWAGVCTRGRTRWTASFSDLLSMAPPVDCAHGEPWGVYYGTGRRACPREFGRNRPSSVTARACSIWPGLKPGGPRPPLHITRRALSGGAVDGVRPEMELLHRLEHVLALQRELKGVGDARHIVAAARPPDHIQ